MRLIVGISLILLGVGSLSCRLEGTAGTAASPGSALVWVRTADGWERPGSWSVPPPTLPQIHPLVVAAGQLFVSAWALVAFRDDEE